jgi:hypothetical protein
MGRQHQAPESTDHTKELVALAYGSYSISKNAGEYPQLFLAACLKSKLSDQLSEINNCSNKEIQPIHQNLRETIGRFQSSQTLGSISKESSQISALMQRNSQITELLEIPQLFDTFILNGYYEEAMYFILLFTLGT